jgi:hypothetical protein
LPGAILKGIGRDAAMAEHVSQTDEEKFTGEEYYQFSRRRYWTTLEFFRLVFNKKLIEYPQAICHQKSFMSLFFDKLFYDIIESHPSDQKDPPPKTLRRIISPYKPKDDLEERFFNKQVSAKQAFSFANELLLASNIPKEDPWYLILDGDKAVNLSENFMKMGEEIYPHSFKDLLEICPAWTLKDLIRIIFGERYKEVKNPDNEFIESFIQLVNSFVQANKLTPLQSSYDAKSLEISFKPVDVVKFIWNEQVFGWLMKNGIDILEWVENLSDHIKVNDEENTETLPSVDTLQKKSNAFFPAPDGTTWDKVGFVVTNKGKVNIKINKKEKLFTLEELKREVSDYKSYNILMVILSTGSPFSKKDCDTNSGPYNNLKVYVSNLRRDMKKLFDIDSDPIESIGNGEYQTKFSTVKPNHNAFLPSEQTSSEWQLNPEENIPYDITPSKKSDHSEY